MTRSLFTSAVLAFLPLTLGLTTKSACAQSPYAANVLADHPVAYCRLGEAPGSTIAVDSSGHANSGAYESNPLLGVAGLIVDPANTAVNFANGGDVVIPDDASLDFVNVPFTIEAWVNGTFSTQACCAGNRRVFDKSEAGFPIGYGLDLDGTNVRLLGCTNFSAPVALSNNTTYHVVGVSNGQGLGAIYVNGLLITAGEYSSCSSYTGPAHIATASDHTEQFDGVIDEVAVYNHTLSSARILAHYAAGVKPIIFTPQSLTFPAQPAGTTSTAEFVKLMNIGSTPVTFNRFTNTGAFTIASNSCHAILAGGPSCYVAVEFMPVAAGPYAGLLVINSSAPGSPQTVSLSGTGE